MGNHSVHRETATGHFVVANKDGQILHTFPSEGEANLQAQFLDEQELAAKKGGAKESGEPAEAKNKRPHEEDDEPKSHGRHR